MTYRLFLKKLCNKLVETVYGCLSTLIIFFKTIAFSMGTKLKRRLQKESAGIAYAIPMLLFLFFIGFTAWKSYGGEVKKTVEKVKPVVATLKELTYNYEPALQKGILGKLDYVDLAGLQARVLGLHTLNGVQKLSNGTLAVTQPPPSSFAETVKCMADFSRYLRQKGIPFLYVAVPDKRSIYDAKMQPGYENSWPDAYHSFVEVLKEDGVDVLDLGTLFKDAGLTSRDIYPNTDHHWKAPAALFAAQQTMDHLEKKGISTQRRDWLDSGNYEVKLLKDWYLGAQGRRTGRYFGGVDDFSVLISKAPMDYSYAAIGSDSRWHYTDTVLDLKHLEKKDYFDNELYNIFLYGNYPLQHISNKKAPNSKRLLVLGDSFRRAWEYFITTQFQEIDTIDLRNFKDGTIAEFIEQRRPEIVIVVLNSTGFGSAIFCPTGIAEINKAKEKGPTSNGRKDFFEVIEAMADSEANNKFTPFYLDLKPGQSYTLTAGSTSLFHSQDKFITLALQNLSSNKPVKSRHFIANSDEPQKWVFTVPSEQKGSYVLYLYAGAKNRTQGAKAAIKDVTIEEGIHSDATTT